MLRTDVGVNNSRARPAKPRSSPRRLSSTAASRRRKIVSTSFVRPSRIAFTNSRTVPRNAFDMTSSLRGARSVLCHCPSTLCASHPCPCTLSALCRASIIALITLRAAKARDGDTADANDPPADKPINSERHSATNCSSVIKAIRVPMRNSASFTTSPDSRAPSSDCAAAASGTSIELKARLPRGVRDGMNRPFNASSNTRAPSRSACRISERPYAMAG